MQDFSVTSVLRLCHYSLDRAGPLRTSLLAWHAVSGTLRGIRSVDGLQGRNHRTRPFDG